MLPKSHALERSPQLGPEKDTSFSGAGSPQKTTKAPIKIPDHNSSRKAQKEMSSQEKLSLVEIKPIEKSALDKVFNRLCRARLDKDKRDSAKDYFVAEDIAKVLLDLNFKMTRHEIDLMIWEVDENLDKKVNREEFETMFRRCITNETELDPKSLFNLVRFLMYAKEEANEITEEDALELIYVRKNSIGGLEDALKIIFGEEERRFDGIEKKINFAQFLDRRNKKALDIKRYKKQLQKEARNTLKKNDE